MYISYHITIGLPIEKPEKSKFFQAFLEYFLFYFLVTRIDLFRITVAFLATVFNSNQRLEETLITISCVRLTGDSDLESG